MTFEKQCGNCEFNFDGICAGSSVAYGHKITDESECCDDWSASLEYFSKECATAPRFLREKHHDCSLSYDDFSAQYADYRNGKAVPINIFDAIKHIYGLSLIDVAVLSDVTYGVVFQAKTKRIPQKRITPFCNALRISEETLMGNTTEVFDNLREGKALIESQADLQERLNTIPVWKKKTLDYICAFLRCPVHLAKVFARIDRMYWEKGMNLDEYTDSEKALIAYYTKRNQNIQSIEYFLDIAGMPHIHVVSRN